MRPVKLTLCAFGPFSGVEVIEFKALGDKPLFLIHGPTGSGKTTLLDGICFALYGKTTGDEREAAQMRCDIAPADVLTYVELIFSLGGEEWRIRREPEQQRLKGRGDGFTTHQPRAELYSRDEWGVETLLVASKVTEARHEIEALTGLNIDQFRQVMVLPQGEFRNLLMAKSSEREKVFSHLFQTQIYSRIEFALKEQASSLHKELDAIRNQQAGILRGADIDTEAELLADIELQSTHLQDAIIFRDKAGDTRKQAERRLSEAQNMAADFKRLAQNRAVLNTLEQKNEEIGESSQRLQDAQAALRLQPGFEKWLSAVSAQENAETGLENAQQCLKQSQGLSRQARDELEKLMTRETEIEIVRRRRHDLDAYRSRVGQYDEARSLLEAKTRYFEQSKLHLSECRLQANDKQLRVDALLQEQHKLHEDLKGLANHMLELHRLEDIHQQRLDAEDIFTQLEERARDFQTLSAVRDDALGQRDNSDREVVRMDLAWHAGQAVILAAKLEHDEPCPVCGSEHHPQPATASNELPTEQARSAAATMLADANETLVKIEKKLAGLETEKTRLSEQYQTRKIALGDVIDRSVEDTLKVVKAQQLRVESLQGEQSKEAQLNRKIQNLKDDRASHEAKLKVAEQGNSKAETEIEVARSQLRQAEVELPETFRVSGNLERQISEHDAQLTAFDEQKKSATLVDDQARSALSKAEANCDSAGKQLLDAQGNSNAAAKQWRRSLSDSEFQNEKVFQSAQLDETQMSALDTQIKQHAAELEQARGAVNSLQKQLSDKVLPDTTVIMRASERAQAEFEAANAAFASIDKRLSLLQSIAQKFSAAKGRVKMIEDEYAGIGTLADTASGKTGNRISLQRFVLGVLLDDVLIQASERFKRMSKGRYSLYRQIEKGKGGGASGLELVVEDVYSGKQRPVATLSGGESFMAALSLALGLSDVVQAYAGGIQLDTLFIDEGFGSLDSEALELAINTLVELQSSGRMVGVISHVSDLKERMNVRLEIIPGSTGSHTRTVLA